MARQQKKSTTHEVYGKPRWVRGFPSNRDMDGPPDADWREKFDGMYVTDFVMDRDNMKIVKESGSQLKIRNGNDEDDAEKYDLKAGEYLVQFRRPHRSPSGFENYGGPPTIGLVDGTIISEDDGFGVGNASTGYLTFTVYKTGIGNGTRWNTLELDEWEKYPLANTKQVIKNRGTRVKIKDAEFDDEDEAPKASKAKAKEKVDDLEEDEIPL